MHQLERHARLKFWQKAKTSEEEKEKWTRPGKHRQNFEQGGEKGNMLPRGGIVQINEREDLGFGGMSPHDPDFYTTE